MNIDGTNDNYTINLNGLELAALAKFVSKDPARPNLFGVAVHRGPSDVRLAATDGHRLCVALQACELDPAEPLLLGGDFGLLAKHAGLRGKMAITVNERDATAEVTSGKGIVARHTFYLGNTPPAVDPVIPKAGRTAQVPDAGIGVNPRYFADLSAVLMANDGKQGGVMRLTFGEALDPIMCEPARPADDGTTWQAVVMPMRLE